MNRAIEETTLNSAAVQAKREEEDICRSEDAANDFALEQAEREEEETCAF